MRGVMEVGLHTAAQNCVGGDCSLLLILPPGTAANTRVGKQRAICLTALTSEQRGT